MPRWTLEPPKHSMANKLELVVAGELPGEPPLAVELTTLRAANLAWVGPIGLYDSDSRFDVTATVGRSTSTAVFSERPRTTTRRSTPTRSS